MKKILIIDDEENMQHMLKAMVSRHGYEVSCAGDGKDGLTQVGRQQFDFILCDIKMPVMDGLEFLQAAGDSIRSSTVIMMSAYGSVDTAIEAMKAGAYDFISKPFKADEVLLALKKAEERESLKQENRQLRQQLQEFDRSNTFGGLIVKSKSMLSLIQMAEKVARYDTTVLITGESGTGKELVARGIHSASPRAGQPFLAVNCGSIPENLVESELFGYKKGAFTGADRDKKGLFAEADNSTLFLDEIGELPLMVQVKLLRVLQENEILPLGATVARKVNVRILAATATDLEEAVLSGLFRKDLLYRLNVMTLQIPPLRDRKEDIPLLCQHFINRFNRSLGCEVTTVVPSAMACLLKYSWPGNVRELENNIQRAMVLAEDNKVEVEQLQPALVAGDSCAGIFESGAGLSVKKAKKVLEARMIAQALDETDGNRTKASQLLELSYPSLLNKIKEYGIEV